MATPFVTQLRSVPPLKKEHQPTSYRIETYGFVLTDEEEWDLNQQLEHLASAMPEEASVKLVVSMDDSYYFQGKLCVQTMSRYYESNQDGLDLMEVFAALEEDLLDKVSRWGYRQGYSRRIS